MLLCWSRAITARPPCEFGRVDGSSISAAKPNGATRRVTQTNRRATYAGPISFRCIVDTGAVEASVATGSSSSTACSGGEPNSSAFG